MHETIGEYLPVCYLHQTGGESTKS